MRNYILPINEEKQVKASVKSGTHTTYYLNMDLNFPKAGRTAPQITKDEFIQHIEEYTKELNIDVKKVRPSTLAQILSRCSWSKPNNVRAKLLVKDLSKIKWNTENIDIYGDLRMYKKIPYIIISAGGDWECPLYFMIYWDGKNFRGYIPMKGNMYNRNTKQNIGNNDDDDREFIAKNLKNEVKADLLNDDEAYNKVSRNIKPNIKFIIKDFESRIKVKSNKSVNENLVPTSTVTACEFYDNHCKLITSNNSYNDPTEFYVEYELHFIDNEYNFDSLTITKFVYYHHRNASIRLPANRLYSKFLFDTYYNEIQDGYMQAVFDDNNADYWIDEYKNGEFDIY